MCVQGAGASITRQPSRTACALVRCVSPDSKSLMAASLSCRHSHTAGPAFAFLQVGDEVYCSDANSTAYQYPLVDASILKTKSGPAVEVGLDGTTYDLATGKVGPRALHLVCGHTP